MRFNIRIGYPSSRYPYQGFISMRNIYSPYNETRNIIFRDTEDKTMMPCLLIAGAIYLGVKGVKKLVYLVKKNEI